MLSESIPNSSSEINSSSSPWSDLIKTPFADENLTEISNLPTTSPNSTCRFYLREIAKQDKIAPIREFLNSSINQDYQEFESARELTNYTEVLNSNLSEKQKAALKTYSGLNYKTINQTARGYWDYETAGEKTPEKIAKAEQTIDEIHQTITDAPTFGLNFKTHRGTSLANFRGYNISSITDLEKMQDQFFLETGFTSTSLNEDTSFSERDFDDPLRQSANISIEYLLPAKNHQIIGLFSNDTSYNPEQQEVLIDQNSLFYINQVFLSPDQASAKLQMTLIPRELYESA